jgi:hypothetical protein
MIIDGNNQPFVLFDRTTGIHATRFDGSNWVDPIVGTPSSAQLSSNQSGNPSLIEHHTTNLLRQPGSLWLERHQRFSNRWGRFQYQRLA